MYLSALVSIDKTTTKKERNEGKTTTTTTQNGTRIRQPRGKGTKGAWARDYRRETKKMFHSLKMKCYPSCFADREGFFFSCPSPVREWLDAPCLDAPRRWLTAGSPRCQSRMMNTWTAGRSGTQNNIIPRLYLSLSILNLFHLIPRFQMQKRNNKVVGGGRMW